MHYNEANRILWIFESHMQKTGLLAVCVSNTHPRLHHSSRTLDNSPDSLGFTRWLDVTQSVLPHFWFTFLNFLFYSEY